MIPVSEPVLGGPGGRVRRRVPARPAGSRRAGASSSLRGGWAAYCGRRYGVAVANGTVALSWPSRRSASDRVTRSSCRRSRSSRARWRSSTQGRRRCWSTPTRDLVHGRRPGRGKITRRTRAIMPVHIYGHPVDMDPLLRLAQTSRPGGHRGCRRGPRRRVPVARAMATTPGAGAAASARLSCFSFYANKLVTTGEGGMVVTDDEGLAERLRRLRNLAFEPGRRFLHASGLQLPPDERPGGHRARPGGADRRDRGAQARDRRAVRGGLRDVAGIRLQAERDWATKRLLDERPRPRPGDRPRRRGARRPAMRRPAWRPGRSSWACTASRPFSSGAVRGEAYPVADEHRRAGPVPPVRRRPDGRKVDAVAGATEAALR